MQKELRNPPRCGKLDIQGSKIICPSCGRPTSEKVLPTTVLVDFPLYCKHCRRETIVNLNKRQHQSLSASVSAD